jgi:hypothetical protein
MKNFVKALDKNSDGLNYLKRKFSKLNDTKPKEGIFVGPQIRKFCMRTVSDSKLHSVSCIAIF